MNRLKTLTTLLLCTIALQVFSQKKKSDIDIDKLIKQMSIEEKAGQMTQIDLGIVCVGDICVLKNPQTLDINKLTTAIAKYHIGSILNVGCGSGTISLPNWQKIIETLDQTNKKLSAHQVPILYGIDAIHGANYTMGATLFPQEIGQAATWNTSLVKRANEITAYETRASGIPWNFSPVLDLGRQPLWSRFFETYGEDVYLAKSMTKAAINGMQGNDVGSPYKVAACMKHFLGYSVPLSGKDRTPVWISDRELREYFLPTFQTAINEGARTVMINSGELNGSPVHANYDILTKLLRDELGFKGVAVTDWEDIYKLVNTHHVAATKKEAVRMAIMAGIDMSMTPNDYEFTELLVQLVKEGTIPESRLDLSVKRILQLKKDLGLFDQMKYPSTLYPQFGSKENAEVSYQLASESITLLKNKNNILPLQNEKILVCGPGANSINYLNGAWTHTWQGVDARYNTPNKLTIIQALEKYKKDNIVYAEGSTIDSLTNIEECMAKAKSVDKIIICLTELPSAEIPGNIDDLSLPLAQENLVKQLQTLNKPIILVMCFNRPRIIKNIIDKSDAIVYAYLPSDEGGRAITDILYGNTNPSGKLPFTYPANVNDFDHYDRKAADEQSNVGTANGYNPAFEFGQGLSYTTFEYSNFTISNSKLNDFDSVFVKVTVKNTGTRTGKEVVQLYYKDLVASITPSSKKLTGFQKINLAAGQSQEVTFVVLKSDLSFINKELNRVTEKGEFELFIQNNKQLIYVN